MTGAMTAAAATVTAYIGIGANLGQAEQNVRQALRIAQRGYVMETGRIVLTGRAENLLRDPRVVEAYLGV